MYFKLIREYLTLMFRKGIIDMRNYITQLKSLVTVLIGIVSS